MIVPGTLAALHPAHLEDLHKSGLTEATIQAAGLHSARPQDLPRLCGRRIPDETTGLVFDYGGGFARLKVFPPLHDGDGREVKYLQPPGSPVRAYVPSGVSEILADPSRSLFIAEGEKKSLKLTQDGFAAVGLGGVWNFREKILPDDALIPDLEAVTWAGRIVYLVPDSDAWMKEQVLLAVYRLARLLEARTATVLIVKLPVRPDGAKQGADDFLVAKGAEAFRRLVEKSVTLGHPAFKPFSEREKAKARKVEPASGHPYQIHEGRLCRVRQTGEGPITEPLANFTATVAEEIIQDDGAEATRAFLLTGRLASGEPLPPARVPAARFSGMTWVADAWGLRAVVRAGQATRDYLREAIQVLSPDAPRRHVFTHTGWRKIDGAWAYLTAGGAVGRDGLEVDLGDELARYSLPRVAGDPAGAMRASLRLLDIAPLAVTAPLWAGVFRAPLAELLPLDVSLWMEAPTGTLKSTLAALFLSHYGAFDRTHLPGAWASTANQLERRAFLLKDSLFVIDDFAPSALDARELESKAARLLRAQGNLAGRGRLRADLTERPAYPPRGLILATGEQHPPGQSVLARLLLVEPKRGDIDLSALTEAQQGAERLPHALAGYVAWLAGQMDSLPALLRETFSGARARVLSEGHLRVPEALAHLWVGLTCGLQYAEEIGACSAAEAEAIQGGCWSAFTALGGAQARLVEGERPSLRFLRSILAMVSQGRGLLLPRDEKVPDPRPGVDFLGWGDDEGLYLLPEAVHMAVARFCRDAAEPFPVRRERLLKDLALEGLSECASERHTRSLIVGGAKRRVLSLRRPEVERLVGEPIPTKEPLGTDGTGILEDR